MIRGKRHLSGRIAGLAGLGSAFAVVLLALHHDPGWAGPAAAIGGLIPIPVLILERARPSRQDKQDPSAAFGHACLALLAGFCVPLALSWMASQLRSGSPVSALAGITSKGGSGVAANATATFTAAVPAGATMLTISFAVRQSAGSSDNCVNGAALDVAEKYGSTVRVIGAGKRLGSSYAIGVPAGLRRVELLVTFVPQPGFTRCSEDIGVAAAQFSL